MVKKPLKSSLEPVDRFPGTLVCSTGPCPIIFCSHYDPGMTLTYFTARSMVKFCNLGLYTGKGNNDGNFSACGLEIG